MQDEFISELQRVILFLEQNGFEKAASVVYQQLESTQLELESSTKQGADDVEPTLPAEEEYGDADEADHAQEYRSISADPVLQGSRGASQAGAGDAEDSQTHSPWPPGAAEALQPRLSGSSRLYEDPDVDEYSSMDDVGYMRRSVTNQQEFIMSQLDFLRTNDDDCYFHSGSLQHGGSSSLQRGDSSNSSSASLSSPGLSSCANHQEASSSPQHGPGAGGPDSSPAATGDAAWDSGPADITFAEPVTTPTKGSQHDGTADDLKPSLSRVESLSNSFIEDFESVDGGGGGGPDGTSRQESEAGSIAGDLGTPPRRSRGDAGGSDADGGAGSKQGGRESASSDVIDLSPPSPPPDCAADAAIDLSNIFELGLRASSRTSSVDVLQGSVRCWSEPDLSETAALFGQQQQLDTGRTWASYSAGNSGCGSNSSSRAGSSLGTASLGATAGGLVLRPRQSAGASRLQSSSQHDPEVEVTLDLQPPPPQQQQQQEQDVQQLQAVPEQEHPGSSIKQQQQEGKQQQQPDQVDDSVLVLSPTHEQQEGAPAAAFSQQKQQPQQQQVVHEPAQQQQQQGGLTSDSSSSSSAAGPVTPTAPCAGADTPAAGPAADSTAAERPSDDAGSTGQPTAKPSAAADADAAAGAASPAAGTAAAPAAADSGSPSCPPAAAAGSGGGGGGFGFTFPTTPPSAVDAAVHEERAERVFSTWASNHSRSLSGALDLEFAACGEDAEADTSSSRPPADSTPGADDAAVDSKDPWGFPALAPAAAAADAVGPSAAAAGAGDEAAAATAAPQRSSSPAAPEQVTLAEPVSPVESPFLASAALASCSKNSSPAGKALSRGGSRAHSSSSAAARAAAAGNSSSSSSRRLSAAGRQQQQQLAGTSSSGGARSPLGDGAQQGPSVSGASGGVSLVQQQQSAGFDTLDSALIPSLDADAESTGGFSGSGELNAPRYVIDEAGNLLYEYDTTYIDNRYETFELRIIHRRRRTGFEDSKEFPIRKNDLIAGRYQVMDFLGSAAFSQAVQALDVATGALVCLKIIKNNKDYFDQSLDEIKLLRYVNNADPDDEHHIVRLYEFFYYKEHLILVCELLRANLYEFQKYQRENGDDPYFTPPRIQRIAIQVLQSLAFLHSLGLVHSDLKPENILIKSYSRCEVKVIDLGSSCFITDHLSSYVQSRSYRAPEVILGLPYGQKIDIWSLGCILAELATGYVLFQNDSLATLLARLEGILGPLPSWMVSQGRYSNRYFTRSRQLYERSKVSNRYELLQPKHTSLRHRVPAADEGFLDFLSYLLTPDPSARPSAAEALLHPWLSYPYPPAAEQIPD